MQSIPAAAAVAMKAAEPTTNSNDVFFDEDLESPFLADLSNEASYFEKAQDFQAIIKAIRIKYLGLRRYRQTINGRTVGIWKAERPTEGINREGVEMLIRFVEARLGKHIVLTSWKEERMMKVFEDDLKTWFYIFYPNRRKYGLSYERLEEIYITVADLLETTYRRAINDEERNKMRPIGKEIRRMLGLDKKEEEDLNDSMTEQMLRKAQNKDAQY